MNGRGTAIVLRLTDETTDMFMNRNVFLMSDDTCLLFLLSLPVSGQRGCHTGWSFHLPYLPPIFIIFLCLSLYTPTGSPFVLLFFFFFFCTCKPIRCARLCSSLLWFGSCHPSRPDLNQTGLPLFEAIQSDHSSFIPYSCVPASSVFLDLHLYCI
ncbi:hypothetical protein BDW72DRAFT_75725 [Aspergillus terricola var. indicus]